MSVSQCPLCSSSAPNVKGNLRPPREENPVRVVEETAEAAAAEAAAAEMAEQDGSGDDGDINVGGDDVVDADFEVVEDDED